MTLSALKRAAEQATPSPWRAETRHDGEQLVWGADHTLVCYLSGIGPTTDADQALIAACDPQTVLKLIKAVEALQAMVDYHVHDVTWRQGRRALQELGL